MSTRAVATSKKNRKLGSHGNNPEYFKLTDPEVEVVVNVTNIYY